MKLNLKINQKSLTADFSLRDGVAQLNEFSAQFSEPQPRLYTVIIEGKVFQCTIENNDVIINGKRIPVSVADPKKFSHSAAANVQAGGRATLTSPMPGKVVRVMCAAGDEVIEGQGLLVVEAMKMQNEVQAPKAGNVAELRVAEGQTVNAGEILVVIE